MLKNPFFRKSCCVRNSVKRCGRTRQATDDNTTLGIRFTYRETQA